MRARDSHRLHSLWRLKPEEEKTVAVDASIAYFPPGAGAGAGDLEDALFSAVREQVELMIGWARSDEALGLEHHGLEDRAMTDGLEVMRLLVQAHLDLRALREQHRDDVTDADGEVRRTAGDGQERTRVMIFGDVATSRIAYRKKGKPNLYPQDAELNWGPRCYSAGVEKRTAKASAAAPFGQAAAQVSAAGAITLGKRQAEEIAVAVAADFDGFYASRLPGPCPPETGLLLTCDGSGFPVLPKALREATARAATARAKAREENGWPDEPSDLRKSRKRIAELAAVADIPPAPRVPEDILTALFGPPRPGKEAVKPAPGPQAQGKTLFASVRRPAGEVIADAFAEARRRDPQHERPWIAVIDGNRHQIAVIQELAAKYKVKVTILIDLISRNTCGRPRTPSSILASPPPATGSGSRRPRSWPGSTATSAPASAAAPPPGDTAPPSAPAPTNAPVTWKTSRTTSPTPPS